MKFVILGPFYPFRSNLAQLDNRLYFELGKVHEVRAFTFTTMYPKALYPGKSQMVVDPNEVVDIPSNRILSSINPFSYIKTAKYINRYVPDMVIIPYWMSFFAPALVQSPVS